MKILMTADTVGGVWTYALDLARALSGRGVKVALATMGAPARPEQRADAGAVPGLSLYESAYRLEWMDDPWRDVREAGEWLLELARVVQPDVVHLNGYAHGALPWPCPVLVAGHSCVLSWWEAVRKEPIPASWDRYRRAVGRGLRAAERVVAPTQAMRRALERHYGALPPVRVVANGRSAALYRPAVKEPFVLSAGRLWDEAKNVAALDQAARRIRWPAFVAGDMQSPDDRQVRADGLEDRPERICAMALEPCRTAPVADAHAGADPPGRTDRPSLGPTLKFLGGLTARELAGWLGRAAIYCLPARYEPFGLSALEAALSGCALVLGDIESLREVWGEAALFVPPEDPAALAEAVNDLIDSPGRRERLAAAAEARAAAYTPERMADGYQAAYAELLAAGAIVS